MLLSKKDYEKLETTTQEQRKLIRTLETKLRLQAAISNDLSHLNDELNKRVNAYELQIKQQKEEIKDLQKSKELYVQKLREFQQRWQKEKELYLSRHSSHSRSATPPFFQWLQNFFDELRS